MSYRNTPHCTIGETPSFLLFSRVVRDKLPTVSSTVEGSRHDDAVKRNRAQEVKLKSYADAKRRAKQGELNAGTGKKYRYRYDRQITKVRYEGKIDKLLDK